jgi:hypothetical protein
MIIDLLWTISLIGTEIEVNGWYEETPNLLTPDFSFRFESLFEAIFWILQLYCDIFSAAKLAEILKFAANS